MNSFLISLAIIMSFFGFAGGGGSSSGGGGSSGGGSSGGGSYGGGGSSSGESDPVGIIIGLSIFVIIVLVILIGAKNSAKYKPMRDYTKLEKKLLDDAKQIFIKYQEDWTNGNTTAMKKYMTPSYHKRAELMMQALDNLHRQNRVSQLKVNGADLVDGKFDDTNKQQKLNIKYHFGGLDEVVDKKTSKVLYSQKAFSATETWNFEYKDGKLLLDGISQPTESAPHLIKELSKFAHDNKLFYSPDWGRYALPAHGLIFDDASMYQSDVNNHIIGQWKEVLVQMYTYAQIPSNPSSYYIVGQLTVPKKYTGIIVKRRDFKKKPPREYQKYETEWQDFNKRYEVWATDPDKVTSFELLNPKFMADLYDNDRDYNIEVVGNTIYLFAPVNKVTENDYATLLNILLAAYKELKM